MAIYGETKRLLKSAVDAGILWWNTAESFKETQYNEDMQEMALDIFVNINTLIDIAYSNLSEGKANDIYDWFVSDVLSKAPDELRKKIEEIIDGYGDEDKEEYFPDNNEEENDENKNTEEEEEDDTSWGSF